MEKHALILLFIGVLPITAWSAGGHYPVDDADLPDPGEFGTEIWHTWFDDDASESAVSAYWRPGQLPLELIAEFQHIETNGQTAERFQPQIKYQLAPIKPGEMGGAVILSVGYQDDEVTDWLVNVPFSYRMPGRPFTLHGNLGWIHERGDENRDRGYVGGGIDWQAFEFLTVVGQIYREGAEAETTGQIGLRTQLPGFLQYADLAAGRELTGANQDWFFTAGLGIAF